MTVQYPWINSFGYALRSIIFNSQTLPLAKKADGSVTRRCDEGATAGSRGTAWTFGQTAWFKSNVNTATVLSPLCHPQLKECSSCLSPSCCLKTQWTFLSFRYTGTRHDRPASCPWCSSTAPGPSLSFPGQLSQGVSTCQSSSPHSTLCRIPAVVPSLCCLHQESHFGPFCLVTPAKALKGFKSTLTFDQCWHSVFVFYFIFLCNGSHTLYLFGELEKSLMQNCKSCLRDSQCLLKWMEPGIPISYTF